MKQDKFLTGYVNPLQFLDVDEPWASLKKSEPTLESIIKFVCGPYNKSDLKALITRYKKISIEKQRLFIAPADERILHKLIFPLRNAKASYMVGNYLGTISLCGMVAEMVAILLFEIYDFKLNNKNMNKRQQESLFGNTFEKLGQDRRVKVLHAYSIVDDKIKESFDLI